MDHSSNARLEVRNLRRDFDGHVAVQDLSLKVQAGQITSLLGPSGCGKSTTLRMIAGVDQPDGGEILVDGQVLANCHWSGAIDDRYGSGTHIGIGAGVGDIQSNRIGTSFSTIERSAVERKAGN